MAELCKLQANPFALENRDSSPYRLVSSGFLQSLGNSLPVDQLLTLGE